MRWYSLSALLRRLSVPLYVFAFLGSFYIQSPHSRVVPFSGTMILLSVPQKLFTSIKASRLMSAVSAPVPEPTLLQEIPWREVLFLEFLAALTVWTTMGLIALDNSLKQKEHLWRGPSIKLYMPWRTSIRVSERGFVVLSLVSV